MWAGINILSLDRLDLPRGEVHLWRARVGDFMPLWRDLAITLSKEESARADRYRFAEPRERFTIARALLRRLLGSYLDEHPDRIEFGAGPYGKPNLADQAPSSLRFNLAHSGDLVLYAFARDREVGVDVEQIRTMASATAVARRFFSDQEQQWLALQPADQWDDAFLALWTCKEAHIKARGTGLSDPTRMLDTVLESSTGSAALQSAWVHTEPDGAWFIRRLAVDDGYVGAVSAQLLPEARRRTVKMLQYRLNPT